MSLHIVDLPPELLFQILRHLPGPDIGRVCQTCRKLREIGSVDSLWQIKCRIEYKYAVEGGLENSSYYKIYSKVLHKYGKSVGLWRRDRKVYGGLVWIRYDKEGIVGSELLAPLSPNVKESMRRFDLFNISLTSEDEVKVTCTAEVNGHPCSVKVKPKKGTCKYTCLDTSNHLYGDKKIDLKNDSSLIEVLNIWLDNERGSDGDNDMYHFTYYGRGMDFLKNIHTYKLKPLLIQPPVQDKDVPLQPGLFKGTYSAHGIEIMNAEYSQNFNTLTLTKITGDPNVPATKVSVKVDLLRPMVLTANQQESIDNLDGVDTAHIEPGTKLEPQPFVFPRNCSERSGFNPPKTCLFRYHAQGQIAGHGFRSPTWSPGHFVVFDEDTFGMIWLQLESFSLYSRVMEKYDFSKLAQEHELTR
ncbi:hypothetical protein FSP39_013713 [Pinctada imbricata]|uniref:F-box domain-containing protein n=1 Tax=Pinctada imbricata TaxID=66713 RepID=A0AA88XKQ1_PINIB|nr:hypothetical protein FSP39_013713 [Pinctada imbricata]